jgi:hypothetical protein
MEVWILPNHNTEQWTQHRVVRTDIISAHCRKMFCKGKCFAMKTSFYWTHLGRSLPILSWLLPFGSPPVSSGPRFFPGAAWSIRRLHWACSIYGVKPSEEVRAFLLLVLRRAVVKEVYLYLFRTSRPQLTSTNHMKAELYGALCNCYNTWEVHGNAVRSSIWLLHASGSPAIESHHPYDASDHIFKSKRKWSLSRQGGLVVRALE